MHLMRSRGGCSVPRAFVTLHKQQFRAQELPIALCLRVRVPTTSSDTVKRLTDYRVMRFRLQSFSGAPTALALSFDEQVQAPAGARS